MTRTNAKKAPKFCRRHYEAIASSLRLAAGNPDVQPYSIGCAIRYMADMLAEDNPKFDKQRFFKACNPVH